MLGERSPFGSSSRTPGVTQSRCPMPLVGPASVYANLAPHNSDPVQIRPCHDCRAPDGTDGTIRPTQDEQGDPLAQSLSGPDRIGTVRPEPNSGHAAQPKQLSRDVLFRDLLPCRQRRSTRVSASYRRRRVQRLSRWLPTTPRRSSRAGRCPIPDRGDGARSA